MNSSQPDTVVIATRESRLALWQAEHVRDRLAAELSLKAELLGMTTRGDQILDRSLSKVGGKGLFVKELETALEDGRARLAVHSLKDVPMDLPAGFVLAAILEREDPRDAFVSSRYENVDALPQGACVGTSSLRRVVQLKAMRPDLRIEPLRGNLDTRLRKLDEGGYDAIVLAAAGLKRLGADSAKRSFTMGCQRMSAFACAAMKVMYGGTGAVVPKPTDLMEWRQACTKNDLRACTRVGVINAAQGQKAGATMDLQRACTSGDAFACAVGKAIK